MVKKFIQREKYITPQLEAGEVAPDILCDSNVTTGGDLELIGDGDPWEF